MKTSRRFDRLAVSETTAIFNRAAELRLQGRDIVSFAAGEPDFPTPPHVVEAMTRAARAGATRYPPLLGLPELRAAVAQHASTRYAVAIDPAQVAITPGAKLALWAAFQLLVDPGDEVLVPTPCWVSYAPQIALAGGTMVPVPTSAANGFRLDAESVRRAITPRTVGIALNLPNNPTGALTSQAELHAIADLAIEHDLWLIADDIYAELRFAPGPFPSPLRARDDLRERTLIVDGPSKSHAMTGWRLGWLITPPELMRPLGTLLAQTVTGVTTFAQHGALAALEGDRSFLDTWISAYHTRAERVIERLALAGLSAVRPEGAFYSLVDVRPLLGSLPLGAQDDSELARRLLDEDDVAVVPGTAFMAPGFVRLSFACSEDSLQQGLERIARFAERHRP